MYLIGFAAAWWLARVRAAPGPARRWKAVDVDDLVFFGMMGVILGGRIGYVLFYGLEFWAQDPWYPLKIWEGGMSFHGGLLGSWSPRWRCSPGAAGARSRDVFDFTAPLPALGLFFGRIGNFINGELWGKPTTVPVGIPRGWPGAPSLAAVRGAPGRAGAVRGAVGVHARPRPRLAPSGLFLLLYGVARFCMEFVRVPDEHIGYLAGGWVTMGQILSLPMILAGIVLLGVAYRSRTPSGNFATAH